MRVVIVGSGNVAEALALALRRAEVELVQIFARNEERGRIVAEKGGTEWSGDNLREADLYILSVSDRAIEEVAKSLHIPEGAVIAHTAGCCSIEALQPHPHRAVFYPFQTFSVGQEVDFSKTYIFLEASSSHALTMVERLAHLLTPKVEMADGERRSVVHLSGVFSSNFVNAMYANASEILASAGLPFDVLLPLIEETAAKVLRVKEPRKIQTGPARRGDKATLDRHRAMLKREERKSRIYDEISSDIWEQRETSKRF